MAYASDKKPGELTALTTLATDDVFVVGDTSDASEVAKYITKANLITDLGSSFAPVLGADDNYVTDAEKAALHAAVTVSDSTEIDLTLTGQQISASIVAGSIDETKLDASVNASLDKADSALQAAAIGTTVQAYDADLTTWAGVTPGTGIATALAVNVGTAGAPVINGGALGTPSSGTLTNATGLPLAGVVDSTTEALGVGTLELGHASDTTFARVSPGVATIEGQVIATGNSSPTFATITTTGNIELGNASDTTISRSAAGVIAVEGVVIPSISSTNTLTNKRVTKRTGTTTSSATPTINTDNVDEYYITAQTEAITSFTTNLSGTPTEGQTLFISVVGTAARAITWGASFGNGPVALPTTTVTTTQLSTLFKWSTSASKWLCYATGSTV